MAQKAKKKSKLRHAEYYDMQKTFDSLYADSKSGEVFGNLMDIISAPSNIKLAFRNIKGKPLTCYGWRFYDRDQVKIDTFCGVFGVSRSAAAIRLEQLGYLNRKKDYEYRDPLEVWP